MNIQQAKEQVRKTCIAYLTKDEFGDYVVPVETQRPIFLVGAPGIGKTAIMAQVAEELGLGLVDYSMTHHTRQSAIGLPFIAERSYGGQKVSVSEYTMSEIIASVYDCIENTGKQEGILFLDEINCVSETLAPAMLRFLQSKTFGNRRVPQGWVVVSAGNPLEYNKSARAFDIVTLDRVKRIEVEPDFAAWRSYAVATGVHPAVLSYLDLRPDNFYHVETRGRARDFVTARAWMDLSNMMRLYEQHGLEIDPELIGQYVQVPAIAKDFYTYLELFSAYARDYRIGDILEGKDTEELLARAKAAGFDERMALCGLLVDAMQARADEVMHAQQVLGLVRNAIVAAKETSAGGDAESTAENAANAIGASLETRAETLEDELHTDALHFRHDHAARHVQHEAIHKLRDLAATARNAGDESTALQQLAAAFNDELAGQGERAKGAQASLDAGLRFIAEAFGKGNELIVSLTQMTMSPGISGFVGAYGCDAYSEYSELLMLDKRADELDRKLQTLDDQLRSLS